MVAALQPTGRFARSLIFFMPIAFQYLLKFPLLQELSQNTLMRLSSQMEDRSLRGVRF